MRRGHTWLRAEDEAESAWVRKNENTVADFWRRVDSDSGPHRSHAGECHTVSTTYFGDITVCPDWTHVRGYGCLASKSNLDQCDRPALTGIPFCDFHFGSAWEMLLAFVNRERRAEVTRIEKFERDRFYDKHSIDVAMVRDARRQLAQSVERVYFYAVGDVVKIGRSVDVAKRLKTLGGTKAPDGIDVRAGTLLGTIVGGSFVERELHGRFGRHRLVGEWFTLEPIRSEIESLIAELKAEDVAA